METLGRYLQLCALVVGICFAGLFLMLLVSPTGRVCGNSATPSGTQVETRGL